MTIKITQMCDKCGRDRELDPRRDLRFEVQVGGWREVRTEKHLCASCIDWMLKQ